MKILKSAAVCSVLGLFLAGPLSANPRTAKIDKEPEHIQVQHILIGYQGTLPGKNITRSKAEAEKMAEDLLAKAKKKGAKFEDLVKAHTDDAAPGIYGMSNRGVAPKAGEYPREGMVPAFGDVGFKLKVDEVALAKHDPAKSPYGYHIIKRLK